MTRRNPKKPVRKMTSHFDAPVVRLEDGRYMARCDALRATAVGDTPEEALNNLREAVKELDELMTQDKKR